MNSRYLNQWSVTGYPQCKCWRY